jgi:hypothetical protein
MSQLAAQVRADDVTAQTQAKQTEPPKTRAQSSGRMSSATAKAPPGCRIYRGAVLREMCERTEPELTARVLEQGTAIVAGQSDGRRAQVDLSIENVEAARALHGVVSRERELVGRTAREWRALNSKPGCKEQGMHFDYNPDLVEGRETPHCPKRKPASACLALQDGARMIVVDRELQQRVTVVLSAGDVLVFDGDVEHAGARYCTSNTRVHVYLDVADVPREDNHTWTR